MTALQPPVRRFAPMLFGLALALASLKLTACFVNPNPPDPHETPDGDPPDPPDASDPDASKDAG